MEKNVQTSLSWDPNTDIVLKGHEFQDISDALSIFQKGVMALNSVISRNITSGAIISKFTYDDGTELTPAEFEQYQRNQMEQYQAMLRKQQENLKSDKPQ